MYSDAWFDRQHELIAQAREIGDTATADELQSQVDYALLLMEYPQT
ncbi:hypothetical protein SEA_SCHATZIE_219 [Mycobacterium phage Schatzie]|nr:hypothetical protein AVT17_gp197 [Mycobacterium phage Ariel]QBJ00171.1 hypothetical protein SEA_PHOEBUS_226 [Mycobacterium phage Phoebus]QCO93907.1 hypothetical protein SEA_SCHATZIE_219 [Mycobacterium phage Schatzie]QDM55803.1 hypothetical protein SEA_HOKKEND_219 [Mycobacterium phage HokkenD]QZD98100.1 hypothetical protein SEA_BEEM_231 [Mycobacterium phage Beem]UEM46706.1 hypothetical protein SEA_JUICYJAY_223 [Mycobacterium phage JuicyJay]